MSKRILTLTPAEALAILRLNAALIEVHIEREEIDAVLCLSVIRDEFMRGMDGDLITEDIISIAVDEGLITELAATVGLFKEFLMDTNQTSSSVVAAQYLLEKLIVDCTQEAIDEIVSDRFVKKTEEEVVCKCKRREVPVNESLN